MYIKLGKKTKLHTGKTTQRKKTKKQKNIRMHLVHTRSQDRRLSQSSFFWIHRLRKRCSAGCQFQRCGPMDWLGVGLPVWPAHPFGNVVVLKHVFPPMPCSLEMIENQLGHSWMGNIFNLNSCHVIVGWGYLSQMQRRLHLSNLNYCDLGCKGKNMEKQQEEDVGEPCFLRSTTFMFSFPCACPS